MCHQPSIKGRRRVELLNSLLFKNPQLANHVKVIRYNLPRRPFPASSSLRQTAEALRLIESYEEDEGPEHDMRPYDAPFEQYFGVHPVGHYVGLDIQAFLAVADKIKSLSLRATWDANLFGYLANRQHWLGLDYLFPKLRSVLIQGDPFPCRIYSDWERDFADQDRRLDCRFLLQMAPNLHTLELCGHGQDWGDHGE